MLGKNLFLTLMGLIYSIVLGSLVYIWSDYKELFLFLQIIILPAIYYIGYGILMNKQRINFSRSYSILSMDFEKIKLEREILLKKNRLLTKKIK